MNHPKNPIRPMATRNTKRNEKLVRAFNFACDTATTLFLAFGFYVLVVFMFGVAP